LACRWRKGALQGQAETGVVQRHQAFGLGRGGRPDDRAPVLAALLAQWQERQRAVVGETLPGGGLVALGAAHTGDERMVQVIPLAGGRAGQAAHRRVRAIGRHHQRRAQLPAIGEA
jgi:hypothetical protein